MVVVWYGMVPYQIDVLYDVCTMDSPKVRLLSFMSCQLLVCPSFRRVIREGHIARSGRFLRLVC